MKTLGELARETARVMGAEPGLALETVETFFCLLINSLGEGEAVQIPFLGTLRPYGDTEPRAPGAGPIEYRVSGALEAAMNYAKACVGYEREEGLELPRHAEVLYLPIGSARHARPQDRGGRHAD